MVWNTMKVWIAGETPLGASDLNNNFDNVQTTYNALPLHADGRLTLTSGLPITTSDVTAAGTLYYTPTTHGNQVAVYDGTMWDMYALTEKSLSLSGYIKGVLYDIFLNATAGVLSLSSVAWKTVTATNSPTAGASKVINITDTGDLAVGREVTVKDGTNSEIATVSAVVSNTSITVENLVNGYTLPSIYGFNQRATALTTVNGVLVKSGGTSYRYLGTIKITDTTGQTEDSTSRRYVWNYYNRAPRPMSAIDTLGTWNYSTAAWRSVYDTNTYGVTRFGFVTGYTSGYLDVTHNTCAFNGSLGGPYYMAGGIGLNSKTVNSAQLFGIQVLGNSTVGLMAPAHYRGYVLEGFTYVQRLEYAAGGGSGGFYGGGYHAILKPGMIGTVMG